MRVTWRTVFSFESGLRRRAEEHFSDLQPQFYRISKMPMPFPADREMAAVTTKKVSRCSNTFLVSWIGILVMSKIAKI